MPAVPCALAPFNILQIQFFAAELRFVSFETALPAYATAKEQLARFASCKHSFVAGLQRRVAIHTFSDVLRALLKSFIMKGSQGLGVRKYEGESWEICRAGVRKCAGQESGTIKAGVGNHGTMLLAQHARQDVNLHVFLHSNYVPKIGKPCMLNPKTLRQP